MNDIVSADRASAGGSVAQPNRVRFLLQYVAPTFALLILAVLPLILGSQTLYLRDVFNTHLPKKSVQARAMKEGRLPLVDESRDGGQPHLGNPNTVSLYPDNLLYLVATTFWALNAHFWLHLLLAPVAMFWLARRWGLSREASWAAGVCYVAGGYFLSNLNLYNLVAGVALAPAFVASMMKVSVPDESRRSVAAAGLLWALLLLAGDPMTAAMALVIGLSAALVRPGLARPSHRLLAAGLLVEASGAKDGPAGFAWRRTLLALGLGTAVAGPQVVEFLRILSLTFRGRFGFSSHAATVTSLDPTSVIEWLIPFFFGKPDLSFWGRPFYTGNLPLYATLYSGLLFFCLVAASGRPRRRAAFWAWGVTAVGIFLVLGRFNPVVGWMQALPGAGLLRLPVKFWLLVAIGTSLLCGIGFERLLAGKGRRGAAGMMFLLFVSFAACWWWVGMRAPVEGGGLRAIIPADFSAAFVQQERLRLGGLCLTSLALLAVWAGLGYLGRRRPSGAGAVALVLHLALQLVLLRPVLAMDETAVYLEPPKLLEFVPPDVLVTDGSAGGLFGPVSVPGDAYPDARLKWLQRQVFSELQPSAGIFWGRSYAFSISPEGLDSFLTRATAQSLPRLSDTKRIRLLAASGVEILLLKRPLEAGAQSLVEQVHTSPGVGGNLHVYRILRPAPEVQFTSRILRAPHLNAALEWITGSEFDPLTDVVLPSGGAKTEPVSSQPSDSRIEVRHSGPESIDVLVEANAPGALVVQRAWLPIYKAEVDGRPTGLTVANMHRLAVELAPGRHEVRIWIDRRPLVVSSVVSVLALVVLLWMSFRRLALPARFGRKPRLL